MNNINDFIVPNLLPVLATDTITSNNSQVTADDTVTINGQAFKFVAALSADPTVANEVLMGADANGTLANLVAAINGSGTAGTEYSEGTEPCGVVTAALDEGTHVVTLTATAGVAADNLITVAKSAATLTVATATLVGGAGGKTTNSTLKGAATYYTDKVDLQAFRECLVYLNVIAQSGTNPTLDVKFQLSHDGITWVDIGNAAAFGAFAQITTTTALNILRLAATFGKYLRGVIVIGGTSTPTYKFDLALAVKA